MEYKRNNWTALYLAVKTQVITVTALKHIKVKSVVSRIIANYRYTRTLVYAKDEKNITSELS